jgi:hypothetical protein
MRMQDSVNANLVVFLHVKKYGHVDPRNAKSVFPANLCVCGIILIYDT